MGIDVIYCASKNKYAPIAIECGLIYGARLPAPVYQRPYFADQDFKRPKFDKYLEALAEYRPNIATIRDIMTPEQCERDGAPYIPLDEILRFAEKASEYIRDAIILVPKYSGVIAELPRSINGRVIRLGYSIPTGYAGTEAPELEYVGWDIHLLGGSPKRQLELADTHLDKDGNWINLTVKSVDGNYIHLIAKYGEFLCWKTAPMQTSV